MATFKESLQNASSAAVCTLLSGTEAASWLGGSLRPGGGENAFADAVRKQRRAVCGNTDDDVTLPGPPTGVDECFSGIDLVPYGAGRFDVNGIVIQTRQVREIVALANGTQKSFRYVDCAGVNRSQVAPLDAPISFLGYGACGLTATPGAPACPSTPGPFPVPPYQPVTINRNVTYIDNSNTEITEEGDFNILAPVFIGGAIIAPITVDVGGVEFPINFNLETGEITFDFSRDFTETPTPEVDPDPSVEPPEPEPEVESSDLFYGLVVYSAPSGIPPVTSPVAQASAPTLLLPRTGNVYFQIPVGDRVTWEGPIPVQMQNQLIMTPSGLGATGFRLAPNTGWSLDAVKVGKPG